MLPDFLGEFRPQLEAYKDYSAEQHDDMLLLQIDTNDQIMWGDVGVANVFISPEALQAKQFDRAYFNWDCH